jgi:hypothetical protein
VTGAFAAEADEHAARPAASSAGPVTAATRLRRLQPRRREGEHPPEPAQRGTFIPTTPLRRWWSASTRNTGRADVNLRFPAGDEDLYP